MVPRLDIAYANYPSEYATGEPTCPFCGTRYDPDNDIDDWVAYFGSDFKDGDIIHEWFCYGCWTGWEVIYVPSALVIKEAT